ncbi:MAG TPA: dephospho-CoA kinase [Gammaproteobacteria bacterium]|nr:dephospho-CoA kinase [Gammaproteobacteria bacterium]
MTHYVVGITGGIGSGKSTVAERFEKLGIVVADADQASREIVEPGQDAYLAILEKFGNPVLLENGTLNRAYLRQKIFAEKTNRLWLEKLTHLPIMQNLKDKLQSARSAYGILMLSTGAGKSPLMDRMIVVDVTPDVQISRVKERDHNDEALIRKIMASQPNREDRLSWADDVIENNGDLVSLTQTVYDMHQYYLRLANHA